MFYNKSCTKIALVLLVSLLVSGTAIATTLISPTGDGGFETGATFTANGWTEVNGANNMWYVGNAPVVNSGVNCAFTGASSTSWTGQAFLNVNMFYRDIAVPAGESKLDLTFMYKVSVLDVGYDWLKVFLVPTTTIPVAGTELSSGQIGDRYDGSLTWIPVAISATVTPGQSYRLVFSWRTDGAAPDAAVAIDDISLVSSMPPPPLVGGNTYPINGVDNPPVSFATITSAMNYAAGAGVTGTGQAMLELSTGYTGEPAYPVTFNAITGLSSTLGVTIRPALGTSPFTIEGSGTAIFNFNGVSYITIDGRPGGTGTTQNITISNTSTTGSTVLMANAACHNTFKYCILKGTGSSSYGVVFISTSTGTTGNNYNTILNCDITATSAGFPYYGVRIYGSSVLLNTGNTITRCNIYDFSNTAIYVYSYCDGTVITDNNIYTLTQQTSSTLQGIDIHASTSGGSIITNNKIYNFLSSAASPYFRGIYLYYGSTANMTTVANNFIRFDAVTTHPGAYIYGIQEGSGTGYLYDIYYNSIYIGGTDVTGGVSYGIYKGLACIMNFKNNIIFNNRINGTGTVKHYCFYASNISTLVSNNNDFYAPNDSGYVGYWTAVRKTLNDWRTASGQDLNSVSQDPNFISTTNLHINPAIATRLESGGIPIAGITTDIDGDIRAGGSKVHNNVQPDIGADEFNGTAIDEVPPIISYIPLTNTPYTTNRTLTAVITDFVSGLANDPVRAPRLYYKKGATGTWVIDTVLTASGNNRTFTFNHSRVGGVNANDTIFYYVQATDSSNNTGTNPLGGASAPNYYLIMVSMAGNYNIGTEQTYPTLKSFFNALNSGAITGNITGTIMSDITETVPDTLYPLNYFGGTWQVSIIPSATKTVYTISCAIAGPLVYLNGADNITFNGMGKNLVFRNTTTTGKVFMLMNDATYNTITSCIIEGCGTSTSYATIHISTTTGTLGNSYNTISNNDIRDLSTTGARQYVAIYSLGTSTAPNQSITIANNNIFNFTYYGLYISSTGNGGNWTISGNSLYYNNATLLSTGHYAIYFYPGTAANNNMIYGNFIGGSLPNCGGIAYTTSSSFYGIYAYSVGTSAKSYIRKNMIKNISLTNTGAYSFYGIYFYTGTADIDSNIIGDPSLPARDLGVSDNNISQSNVSLPQELTGVAENGRTLDIAVCQDPPEPAFVSAASAVAAKPNFTENSITNAGSSGSYGIYNTSHFPTTIANNEISNITASGTGTSVSLRGIYSLYATTVQCTTYVNSNKVHHLTSASTSTGLTNIAAVIGIMLWPGTFTPDYSSLCNNTVYTIIASNTGAVSTNAFGLLATNCAYPVMQNNIYDIRNYSTGTSVTLPPTATGIYIRATSGPIVANNMISVGDGQATNTCYNGIWNAFGTSNYYGLYNNSVLVSGSVTDGALPSFGFLRGNYSGTTAIITITEGINNIFVNNRSGGTGGHYALGNQSTTADSFGWWFNYNVLKTANPATLGLWGATDLTFNNWKLPHPAGSGGDANSINADPGYMGVTNLHINPNSLVPNRKAVPITEVPIDFDGEARHLMYPDIGADEYSPNPPQEFTLISPANGAITQPLIGQLVWHKSTLAEFYDVYLGTANPPVTKVSALQTDTSYSYSSMPNLTYYWKVVAQNDTGIGLVEGSVSSAIWSFSTEIWDVGATAIIKPSAIGFAGSAITPRVKVKNFGSGMIPSFPVTMKIGEIYTNTQTVNNLLVGDSVFVDFDLWTAVLGTYNLLAYTSSEYDNNRANDTIRRLTEIQAPAHNVGTMVIISPAFDTTLEGTLIMPSARIKNFGAFTENFIVRFKIGEVYNETIPITNFEMNAETTLVFPHWTATRCNYVVSCSTELALDQLPEDDALSQMLTVQYYDIGVSAILAPQDTVQVCNNYTPVVTVTNYSIHTQGAVLCTLIVKIIQYPAQMDSFCHIGRASQGVTIYTFELITELTEGTDTITLPTSWHPYFWDIGWILDPTYHSVVAEVKTALDMNPDNDILESSFIVNSIANDLQMNWTGLLDGYESKHDEILPIGTYNVASVMSGSMLNGNTDFRAKVQIWKENTNSLVYARYLDANLASMSYVCLPFQSGFTPTEPGWYRVYSWLETRPGIDAIPENNTLVRHYYFTNSSSKIANGSTNQAIQGNIETPTTFALALARPNPFSAMTNIQWQLPVASDVSITVYDALGRAVKTLAKGSYQAGYHNINWNRTDDNNQRVSSGIYFYEMRTDKYTSRQKLVIK